MATSESSVIQVDDHLSETDSSYGEEADKQSQTTSLRSSIYNFVYENGRRYHTYRQGVYWGPNDEEACDNLDLFHHVFNLSLGGKLFLAPIAKNPQRILDLGTGTGIWAMDCADQFPSASVIATDLSPIQPSFVPPNLEFQIDDFCLPWTFSLESFDFIHARSIYGCVANYTTFYSEILSHLKPGAWFEQAEISVVPRAEDGTLHGTSMDLWGPLALKAGEKFGKSFSIAEDMKELMVEAGFVNVTYRTFKWPIGPWAKDPKMKQIGLYNRAGWEEGLEGWAMFLFTNYLGWSAEEVQVLCARIRQDLLNKEIHGYQYMTVCYGQKPETEEKSPTP